MSQFCHSCGMPLMGQNVNPKSGNYCLYCADAEGKLKSREEVREGLAQWLSGITPEDTENDYLQRADYYMKAMPAWADE